LRATPRPHLLSAPQHPQRPPTARPLTLPALTNADEGLWIPDCATVPSPGIKAALLGGRPGALESWMSCAESAPDRGGDPAAGCCGCCCCCCAAGCCGGRAGPAPRAGGAGIASCEAVGIAALGDGGVPAGGVPDGGAPAGGCICGGAASCFDGPPLVGPATGVPAGCGAAAGSAGGAVLVAAPARPPPLVAAPPLTGVAPAAPSTESTYSLRRHSTSSARPSMSTSTSGPSPSLAWI
jgi:hypothetical protein